LVDERRLLPKNKKCRERETARDVTIQLRSETDRKNGERMAPPAMRGSARIGEKNVSSSGR